jgi:sn-glycerol 3-phosphate transport system permease protein
METKRTTFPNKGLPFLMVAPQLIITLVFFIWPAAQAVKSSFERADPFGLSTKFVGLAHYARLFSDPLYLASIGRTALFAASVTAISMGFALVLAVAVSRVIRTAQTYTTLLVWPYAVAPVVAGILWWFLFNNATGILPYVLRYVGIDWDTALNGDHAMTLVIIAASWKQISYNFLFFVAGMQSVPHALTEAAAIDGASPWKRFWTIIFPLLSPTTFFLFIVNINYVMFDTFAIIASTTGGGPNQATNTLVYKVYADGFIGLNLGSSSAQSVVLMLFVIVLTFVQFRYVERRVQY